MMYDVAAVNTTDVASPVVRSAASRTVMVHLRRLSVVALCLCALVALLRLTPASAAVTGCKLCPFRSCPSVIATMPRTFDCAYLDQFSLALRTSTDATCEADMRQSFCGWLQQAAALNQASHCNSTMAPPRMCAGDECDAVTRCSKMKVWNCADDFFAAQGGSCALPATPTCHSGDFNCTSSSSTGIGAAVSEPDDPQPRGGFNAVLASPLWLSLFIVCVVLVSCALLGAAVWAARRASQRRVQSDRVRIAMQQTSLEGGPAAALPSISALHTKHLASPLSSPSPVAAAAAGASPSPLSPPLRSPTGGWGAAGTASSPSPGLSASCPSPSPSPSPPPVPATGIEGIRVRLAPLSSPPPIPHPLRSPPQPPQSLPPSTHNEGYVSPKYRPAAGRF